MDTITWYNTITGEEPTHSIIERKISFIADDLCRRHVAGLVASDREDIVQELWLALCTCGDKYDPTRGAVTTFCYQRLLSASNLLIRKRLADTRLVHLRTIPVYTDKDEAVKYKALTEDALGTEQDDKTPYRKSELVAFVERQPEPLRSFLSRYMEGDIESLAAMAREVGIPKTSFVRTYLEPCRRRFAEEFGESGE